MDVVVGEPTVEELLARMDEGWTRLTPAVRDLPAYALHLGDRAARIGPP